MAPSSTVATSTAEEPVQTYRGCHAGILAGLEEMHKLPALADTLRQVHAAAEAALALFERQVVPHHVDEERELFVAVAHGAVPGEERQRVDALVRELVAQHRAIERQWSELRPTVVAVAAGKPAAGPDFRAALAQLIEVYLGHMRLEEEVFLPLAAEILRRDPAHAALDLAQHLRHHVPMPRIAYL